MIISHQKHTDIYKYTHNALDLANLNNVRKERYLKVEGIIH